MALEVNRVLLLNGGESVFLIRLLNLQTARHPRRRGCAKQVGTESRPGSNTAAARTAIAKMKRYGIIGVAWNDENAALRLEARELKSYIVCLMVSPRLAPLRRSP